MSNNYQQFHVGINTFVVKDRKLLLGKRKNVYGAGTWGLPGGHLEIGENMQEAAARELQEETGLSAESLDFVNIVNDRGREKHYIQIGFVAHEVSGEPTLKEPDICEGWQWFDMTDLPEEIFPAHKAQIEAFCKNIVYTDSS